MNKLSKLLSQKTFIISQILILVVSLSFLGWLHYILNIKTSTLSKTYQADGPVTKPPATLKLELTSPEDESIIFEPQVLVSGKTTPPNLEVLITSEYFDLVNKSKRDGIFSAEFKLNEGINTLKIVVFDKTGDQRELIKTVYYTKEKL